MFDRRIAKDVDTNGDGTPDRGEWYAYDGHDILLRSDRSGTITNRYLHGPEIDQVFADESTVDGLLWALADQQGTVRDWADYDSGTNATTVTNHVVYDSFGNITGQSSGTHKPLFAYTGREWDADAELYYYRMRWYDPAVGGFISEDPLGFAAGDPNLARYVGNQTTFQTDPMGLDWRSPYANAEAYFYGRMREAFDSVTSRIRIPDLNPYPNNRVDAEQMLQAQIQAWRDKDWDLAADYLQFFSDNQDPGTLYPLSPDEAKRLEAEMRHSIAAKLSETAAILGPGTRKLDLLKLSSPLKYSKCLATRLSHEPNSLHFSTFGWFVGRCRRLLQQAVSEDFYTDGDMRNAFLTLHADLQDVTLTVTKTTWTATADVTLHDNYSFTNTGRFGWRRTVPVYDAAHYLETAHGYAPFRTEHAYTETYGGPYLLPVISPPGP